MLRNTFCHIVGVGPATERTIWEDGLRTWDEALRAGESGHRVANLRGHLEESLVRLDRGDARWFHRRLPGRDEWRLFADFRGSCAYLDIETTGMGHEGDHVTTIAVYDGSDVHTYVHGRNLDDFRADIERYDLVVTYNGKSFDLPFIRKTMGVPMRQAHIDLRYIMARLGYKGGLKGCEKALGLHRGELDGVDGYFAVLLWQDYRRRRNEGALETLLSYNAQDVVSLETLMHTAWNMLVAKTPFAEELALDVPDVSCVPHEPHAATVERIRANLIRRGLWKGR